MWNKLTDWWTSVKAWFKNSETIFWARLQTFSGILIAVIAGIDWTQLAVTGWTTQSLLVAAALIANGLFTEYLRRRNANL